MACGALQLNLLFYNCFELTFSQLKMGCRQNNRDIIGLKLISGHHFVSGCCPAQIWTSPKSKMEYSVTEIKEANDKVSICYGFHKFYFAVKQDFLASRITPNIITLLHSERPKLYGVLAFLRAIEISCVIRMMDR